MSQRPRIKTQIGKLATSTDPFIRMMARGCDVSVKYIVHPLGNRVLSRNIQVK